MIDFELEYEVKDYVITLSGEDFELLEGRNYTINTTLIGNSNSKLGLVNSQHNSVSNLSAKRLKTSVIEISKGVVKFEMCSQMITDQNQVFITSIINQFLCNITFHYEMQ